jgi:transcriptional regulator with XRE-family HTH domain
MPFKHAGISALEIARKSAGLTAVDLAGALGVSASHVSQIERGWRTPSDRVKTRSASLLGVPVRELFPPSATPALLAGRPVTTDHPISDDSAAPGQGSAVKTSGTGEGRARHDEP